MKIINTEWKTGGLIKNVVCLNSFEGKKFFLQTNLTGEESHHLFQISSSQHFLLY